MTRVSLYTQESCPSADIFGPMQYGVVFRPMPYIIHKSHNTK